ncbi:MAG: hypothetical protein NVSMB17_07030 [Candidatus Dormibacteria bacterium]
MARSIPPQSLAPRTVHLGRASTYYDSIGSTQDEARSLALGDAAHGHVVWAAEQTAGRGRLARHWYSPSMSGLWFSVVLRPRQPASELGALPMAMGVAVGAALDGVAPGLPRLKWPNDVLLGRRKVAGILVEGHTSGGRLDHAVVGVGINLRRPAEGFPAELQDTAAALADVAAVPGTAHLLAVVLEAMEAEYEELLVHGPAGARQRWLGLADTIGREVSARIGDEEVTGQAVDLDPTGNLVIDSGGQRRVIAYGEVQQLR